MSTSNQAHNASSSKFTTMFQTAYDEYKTLTGQDLNTHPFSDKLDGCRSPDDISNVLREKAQELTRFREGDKLLESLNPIVHVLSTFSGSLGECVGLPFPPARAIFISIGALLGAVRDIVASYDTLLSLFERIHLFLQRLNCYNGIPVTTAMHELLGKIMAQVLSILALSTKVMRERRIKAVLKTLVGRTDIEDALQRLDTLTKEEALMTATRNLEVTHQVKELTHDVQDKMKVTNEAMDQLKRNQSREKLRSWLSPPNPSINHNIACDTRHDGTATWFIQGQIFENWKTNGSLLWIRGNPGSGKTILCSAIIEDIKRMRQTRSALIAYYYFDFKDVAKRDVRGLLSSLLTQLGDDSDQCWGILSQLYTTCRDGSEQPTEAALAQCLKTMLELPGQVPIYIVVDALDETPNNTGTPSARKKVLSFVNDLIGWQYPNLYMCITSRPEQDIQATLSPLTPASHRVSVHEEGGQKEDINKYIRSFVHADESMRRWRAEDKELVINTLSEQAHGMFRWVYCQLDTLCRCFPPSICKALNELPITLDETYERALQGIPREKKEHTHRLFQCLVAAIRPLRVEELAEIFTIEFDTNAAPNLVEGWRPEHPEEAVLSACSTLITIVDDGQSKIVQFSHFSVKEFLTSDRLRTSGVEDIRNYYISLDAAHTVLVRACLTVLLQLGENVNTKRLATLPLAFYAAQNWVDHAKFEDVEFRVQDALERLFNPSKPYLTAWAWIHDVDQGWLRESNGIIAERPPPPKASALYYAALCGFVGLATHLIITHGEDVNAKCGRQGTPLHAASYSGHLDVVRALFDHGADVNINALGKTPLCAAHTGGHVEVMRLLLEHGANPDVEYVHSGFLFHDASAWGKTEVLRLLLRHRVSMKTRGPANWTALHWSSGDGHTEVVRLLLEHGADVSARSDTNSTPLHWASEDGHLEVVKLLLEHGADVDARDCTNSTPLHCASRWRHLEVVKLLVEHSADVNAGDDTNSTPLHWASSRGHLEVARLLLEHGANIDAREDTKSTSLHCASSNGHPEVVKLLLEHGDAVDARDNTNWTPLHCASRFGHVEVVRLLLEHGADVNAPSLDHKRPLRFASRNRHLETVELLLAHGAW